MGRVQENEEKKDEKIDSGRSTSFSNEYGINSLLWIREKDKASTTPKSGEKEGGKLAAKQVLNLTESQEIPSMDSVKATDQVSFLALNNVMEGLYRLDKDNKATPGVAESYKKSDDGKKYTFTLNKNAKWSNGEPVTAKDFVFSWKRAVDKNTAAEYAYIMFDVKNAKAINEGKAALDTLGVKAVDDYTLEVELENAVPYFVELTSFGTFYPQNEKFVNEKGAKIRFRSRYNIIQRTIYINRLET